MSLESRLIIKESGGYKILKPQVINPNPEIRENWHPYGSIKTTERSIGNYYRNEMSKYNFFFYPPELKKEITQAVENLHHPLIRR